MPTLNALLQKKGPKIVRSFQTDWYEKKDWLCGCATSQRLFCHPCLLFSSSQTVWTATGYCDLNNLPAAINEVLIGDLCADKFVIQLGDEDCILPSKLQAALQQVLEEGELILGQEAEQEGASPGAFGLAPSQCLAVQNQTGDSLDISGVVSGREVSRESGHTASLHMQQHSLKTEAQWSSSAAGYSQQAVFHWRELEGWMSLDLQAVFHWRELEGWMSLDLQAVFHWRELEGWMSLDLQAVFHWRELEGWMSLDLQAVFH
ncbi:unnamed protein product [Arctogadus glacialis]